MRLLVIVAAIGSFWSCGCSLSGATRALTGDLVLDAALELDSGTTLDCQGHAIVARRAVASCTTTDCAEWRPSTPEVAIFINAARSVKVTNIVSRNDFVGSLWRPV